eukprot:TRINITY_DN23116_c0_g1_i2.p1 TRINITY_DN23116_c0_g1~~TRINITY_DN23116_c0_g1_i2.p1  ORF type:complete len:281 (-),score=58.20 TRINITY_DN23116_c0_g1_i2:205-1047(-)
MLFREHLNVKSAPTHRQRKQQRNMCCTRPRGGRHTRVCSRRCVFEWILRERCWAKETYDPMVEFGFKAGHRVGIVGLGGLGSMGVKIANALGCIVTVISGNKSKEDAAKKDGASHFVLSKPEAMVAHAQTLDFIINTIPAHHNIDPYLPLLKPTGTMIMVGACPTMYAAFLSGGSKKVKASVIGGVKRTEELITLCDKAYPKILPDIEVKPVQEVNAIFETLDQGNDKGVRFVLDLQGSLGEQTFGTCTLPPPKLKPPVGLDFKTVFSEMFKLMGCICCK